jgi:hypothetical protein
MGCEGGWTIEGDSEGEGDAGREENSESDRVVGGKNISAADEQVSWKRKSEHGANW